MMRKYLVAALAILAQAAVAQVGPGTPRLAPSNAPVGSYATQAALQIAWPSTSLPAAGGPTAFTTDNGPLYWDGAAWQKYSTGGASGTVTAVSGVNTNGFSFSIATATSTPAITLSTTITGLLKGSGSALAAASASDVLTLLGIPSISGTNTGDQTITLTTDVTGSGTGTFATTIAAGAVTLAKMANLAASSILCNNTGSPATPLACTAAQLKTLLAIAAGDVSGLAAVATSGSATDLSAGTLNAARMPLGITATPTAGQLLLGNAGGTAYAANTMSQDCTITSAGVITCLKTNNVSFGTAATANTGTSGANVPLLNGTNTFSGAQSMSAGLTLTNAANAYSLTSTGLSITSGANGFGRNITGTVNGGASVDGIIDFANITNTSCSGTCLLVDWQVASAFVFKVSTSGALTTAGNIATANGGQFQIGSRINLVSAGTGHLDIQGATVSTGTKFTAAGTGCTVGATTGGAEAGTFTLAAGPCTTVVLTMNGATGATAPTGWHCDAHNKVAAPIWAGESSSSTTTATIVIPAGFGATDVVSFRCSGY